MTTENYIPDVVPSGLEVDFDRNITALYDAITQSKWAEAVTAAEMNPSEAKTWVVRHYDEEDSEGAEQEIMWRFLPLHSACAREPPAAVVKALLHAYPDGAKCIDDQGMFPLHYACGNQASREVIRMLLMSFPDAAKIRDPRGMLPIHYLACWGPSSISVIDMVLVANREIATVQDEDGNTPLDLALEGEYSERDGVVAALNRWIGNTDTSSDEKKESEPPAQARSVQTPTVGRLRQEVTHLQKSKKALENEWGDRLVHQTNSHHSEVSDLANRMKRMEMEMLDSNSRSSSLEKELREKSEALERALVSLEEASADRDGLRQTLADLTEQHDKFKKKSEILGDRLGSLNASLYSMTEQQMIVMNSVQKRENEWNNLNQLRAEKMKELLDLEVQQRSEGGDLKSHMMKQTKEMEAIQAVIAAIRQAD